MAKKERTRSAAAKSKRISGLKRNVVPDKIDLRDRPYMPAVAKIPDITLEPKDRVPVLDQGSTNACTGFALASVVYHLQRSAKRKAAEWQVSPFMLYSMARRYDEFPGAPEADTGSSLRGAMKGWYKHGACSDRLWKTLKMPKAQPSKAEGDWWLDGVRRPLGAYYRVDSRSVADMHVALNEIGVLYASAICHAGWDEGFSVSSPSKGGYWTIPPRKASPSDGGHAFAIVGYNREGFLIQNSWGEDWASAGCAVLTYDDWIDNAMDCWVAQLGVVTELHLEIAKSKTLRTARGKVQLASESSLRHREISPFIIDMENNGHLSNTGEFRTQEDDVKALVNQQIREARNAWGLGKRDPIDIAIYAHGGLTSEDGAAETAAKWIPALYQKKIFPIFLMWETDLLSTIKGRLVDLLPTPLRPTGGRLDGLKDLWNQRLERALAVPGTLLWEEMKQNADSISSNPKSGGMVLHKACQESPFFADPSQIKLHLIGHSAGSILHCHIIDRLGKQGWNFESVHFLAPAVRVDVFDKTAVPSIKKGKVKHFHQFHLTDDMELSDPTCKPILGYSRSLLYLVSRSFEKGETTPILGMEKYFAEEIAPQKLSNVHVWPAPGAVSRSTTHGGFDNDDTTMNSVIKLIRGEAL
jgi:hypothetical protein